MERTAQDLPVVCRQARSEDAKEALQIVHKLKDEEGDYVAESLQSWLIDPEGRLIVAECDGRVIGLAKLSRLSDADWWLQGMRVDPDFHRRGVATRLMAALVEAWNETEGEALRLVTASLRTPIHIISQRAGFSAIETFSLFTANALECKEVGSKQPFQKVELSELDRAYDFALGSETLSPPERCVDMGWEWLPLHREHLKLKVAEGNAWWWEGRSGLVSAWRDVEWGHPILMLNFAACDWGPLPDLLGGFRRLAGAEGCVEAGWMASLEPGFCEALEKAGYLRKAENHLVLYEKKRIQTQGLM